MPRESPFGVLADVDESSPPQPVASAAEKTSARNAFSPRDATSAAGKRCFFIGPGGTKRGTSPVPGGEETSRELVETVFIASTSSEKYHDILNTAIRADAV